MIFSDTDARYKEKKNMSKCNKRNTRIRHQRTEQREKLNTKYSGQVQQEGNEQGEDAPARGETEEVHVSGWVSLIQVQRDKQ